MAHLKGNLGLKSSSLAPTACKLSTQYLVLDHMTNHYNKISNAKPAIDNKPPRSMTTSQKMRDRKTRERVTSPHRTRPLSSLSYTQDHTFQEDNMQEYQDLLDEEPEDEEGRLVQSIMKSTLGRKSNGSNEATFNSKTQTFSNSSENFSKFENRNIAGGEHQRMATQRPMSARSSRSISSSINGATRVPLTTQDHKKVTYNGDVLDKRAFCFTEPDRPFTPRTLKSSHQSRLKGSKCYNPPKPKSGKHAVAESSSVPEQGKERESRPRPKPRLRNKSGQSDQLSETMPTNQLSESMLMDITLQSRDGRHAKESKRDVPPLAISMDTDHFKWLQEQASKAQVRAKHGPKMKSTLRPDADMDEQNTREESPLNLSQSVRLETLKKEEEQKYLAFAKEVTDDVLTKGISTDKVLNKLFQNHIERRKEDLDEDRMKAVIRDLRKDLGLRDESTERKTSYNVNFNNEALDTSGTALLTQEKDSSSVHSQNRLTPPSKPASNLSSASNSNLSVTMESTSTMKFGQTGDMFSTIHSEPPERELSDGEIDVSSKETDKENEHELTATQVLKEYQMNLTAKEAGGDGNGEVSSSDVGNTGEESSKQKTSDSSERPATGERRIEQQSSTENERTTTELSTAMNGISTVDSFHGNHLSSLESSTLNGYDKRSRLRNKRRERNKNKSSASVDSSSAQEEGMSSSVLKSSTSGETGSEKETSETAGETAIKPTIRSRPQVVSHQESSQDEGIEHNSPKRKEPSNRNKDTEESTGRSGASGMGDDDYSGDYEDDYEEGSQGGETHRTSDDDF